MDPQLRPLRHLQRPGRLGDPPLGRRLANVFTQNVDGSYKPPTGIHDSLVHNTDGSYTLTKPDQTKYHYKVVNVSSLYCDTITDRNGNTITIAYNTGNYVTTITDPTNRVITLGYNAQNRISTITDPLNRQWTISYDANGNLQTVSNPPVNGTTYSTTYSYDANHCITDIQTPRGYHWTFGYNSTDSSLAWEKDPALNQTSFDYVAGATTVTDPNGIQTVYTYTGGKVTQAKDPLLYHEDYVWDANNNRTKLTDKRGFAWQYTYDSMGNMLTRKDPYLNTTTFTYNTHNFPLTTTLPTGEQTANTYDTQDNLTGTSFKDSTGVVKASVSYTVNAYGLTTDYYDANNHHSVYGYNANGDLISQTTPLGKVTQFGYNGLGVRTSRTDALNRQTTYTLDNWERVTTITYPDTSTKTFSFDQDNNLTQFVDATGTTTRTYDNADRLLSESKGGATVVSYSYDAVGQKGLLSSLTDANGRIITYNYTARNQLASVVDTAGTTTYGYDQNGNETSISNPNGTTVTKGYDNASQLTSVVNKNSSGTTLSSFSYVLDADGRRKSCTEANGDVVSYGYDWASRLTSESRTGTNAYSRSYVLDPAGNRTSQTVGGVTTNFTLNSDDQLTATSGGIVNSYGYNANGEQTSRTLSGTAYTLSYDYEGQLTSIVQGANTTSFTYDALGRRMSRTAGGVTTSFLYDGEKVLLEKQGATTTATYTLGNVLIRKDGEYPLFDGLGSERTVTNASQTVTGTISFEGFGQTIATTGSSTSAYMYGATSGYRTEGDAGLIKVGARYYDPQVGRFITRDTVLTEHPYLYCKHDPVNGIDPSGHGVVSTAIGIIGGTIGTIIEPGLGTAIGTGIGTFVGDLIEGDSVGSAAADGVVAGVGTYIGGGLAARLRAIAEAGWGIGAVGRLPAVGALEPPPGVYPNPLPWVRQMNRLLAQNARRIY